MLQKFKITSIAFILFLFGFTLITVSPGSAANSIDRETAFEDCKTKDPKKTGRDGRSTCFRDGWKAHMEATAQLEEHVEKGAQAICSDTEELATLEASLRSMLILGDREDLIHYSNIKQSYNGRHRTLPMLELMDQIKQEVTALRRYYAWQNFPCNVALKARVGTPLVRPYN